MDSKAKKKMIALFIAFDTLLVLLVLAWWISRGDKSFQVVEEIRPAAAPVEPVEPFEVPVGSILRISLADTAIEISHDGKIGPRALSAETWDRLRLDLGAARRAAIERRTAANPDAVPADAPPAVEAAIVSLDASERVVVALRAGDPETAKILELVALLR